MVTKGHKITNVPLFKKIWDQKNFVVTIIFEPYLGTFLGGLDFFDPSKSPLKWLKNNSPAEKKF